MAESSSLQIAMVFLMARNRDVMVMSVSVSVDMDNKGFNGESCRLEFMGPPHFCKHGNRSWKEFRS